MDVVDTNDYKGILDNRNAVEEMMTLEQIDELLRQNKKLQAKALQHLINKSSDIAMVLSYKSYLQHQAELERQRNEELKDIRIKIRSRIQDNGKTLYNSLPKTVRWISGEIMRGNEELILNQTLSNGGLSIAANTILRTGFTENQRDFLEAIKSYIEYASQIKMVIKEVNMVLGAIDGDTLGHARKLVVLSNERAGNLGQLRIRNEMYKDHVKEFCQLCMKKHCGQDCSLWILGGWKKYGTA